MKSIFTKSEKSWILYDVGNSAFILMVSTLIPIYFNYLCTQAEVSDVTYLAYWGYAASITTIIVAFAGPVLGTFADTKNFKKPMFTVCLLVGVLGCITLGIYTSWVMFLVIYIITKTAYSCSLILYDSMIHDVTDNERVDIVSAQGYGWGYIGSCIPFALSLLIVLKGEELGFSYHQSMVISFIITGLWWAFVSAPLLKNYQQINYVECKTNSVKVCFSRLADTLKNLKNERSITLFLLSYFFYIDGVYTIIEMATAYGETLGLDTTGLLLALLVTQIVAFPSSLVFGKLAEKVFDGTLIMICIAAYSGIAVFAIFMSSQLHFWILAICVGMFQGGIQALSRSYFAKIIPKEKSGEYFGLMDICGKGASFLGTFLVGLVSQLTGNANLGVAVLAILFVLGGILFYASLFQNILFTEQ